MFGFGRWWMAFGLVACTGEAAPGAGADRSPCDVRDGIWSAQMAVAEGSDPLCPEVEDSTFESGGDSTSSECDPGCTCTLEQGPDECAVVYTQSCVDDESEVDVECALSVDSRTEMSGDCDLVVHVLSPDVTVACAYTMTATYQP